MAGHRSFITYGSYHMDQSTQLFIYLTSIGGLERTSIQGHRLRVCCYGRRWRVTITCYGRFEIIDSYDKIMTKVNVCINAFQQQIDLFDKENINYYGIKK